MNKFHYLLLKLLGTIALFPALSGQDLSPSPAPPGCCEMEEIGAALLVDSVGEEQLPTEVASATRSSGYRGRRGTLRTLLFFLPLVFSEADATSYSNCDFLCNNACKYAVTTPGVARAAAAGSILGPAGSVGAGLAMTCAASAFCSEFCGLVCADEGNFRKECILCAGACAMGVSFIPNPITLAVAGAGCYFICEPLC